MYRPSCLPHSSGDSRYMNLTVVHTVAHVHACVEEQVLNLSFTESTFSQNCPINWLPVLLITRRIDVISIM